jgi:UDPglucose 6-dehydrogenase
MNLSVIGLGKLGVCTATCFASRGYNVIGVDTDNTTVEKINQGKAPIIEPQLQELINCSISRLSATQDYEYALLNSEITFLIVPTPSQEDGNFSDRYLRSALKYLATAFKKKNGYHLFVITSTVSPGTIGESLIPLIETVSGRRLNKDFGVCYNPEFIALGSIIKDFLHPDLVLIGESDSKAGKMLEKIYRTTCENTPHIARMSIVSAEIAKISLNTYVTMKISFANTLANICEHVPGADVDAITGALGVDRRISPYYLNGGLGYGGPCFPRDGRAFVAFAQKYGISAELAKATDKVNAFQTNHLAEVVSRYVTTQNSVSVLGLAYKPDTPVIEESSAIYLIQELLKKGLQIVVYDPLAIDNAKMLLGDSVLYTTSVRECFHQSPICVITTQHKEFKSIDATYIVNDPTTIIDCWRMLDRSKLGKKVNYIAYGNPNE